MSTTIYSNAYKATETITAQGAVLQWGTGLAIMPSNFPILLSGLTIQYARPLQSLYPINTDAGNKHKQLRLAGAPSGTLQTAGILTKDNSGLAQFLAMAGRGCVSDQDQVFVTLRPFAGESCVSDLVYRLEGVALTTLQVQLQTSGQGITTVTKPLVFEFTTMIMQGVDYDDTSLEEQNVNQLARAQEALQNQ